MHKPSINIRKYLLQTASSALVLLAAVLAISALTAQSPSPTPPCKKRGECKDWPTTDEQPKFEAAFDKALIDSRTNKDLRCNLLKSPASAKSAVEAILARLYPHQNIKFPPKVEIRFYEPEQPVSPTMNLTSAPNYPNDHCLGVFYLPEEGTAAATTPSFRENLMCCYKPWDPTKTSPTPTPSTPN
jgi:hypothetical protein